ncbi:MAG: ABC transporter permease [Candidatus Lokiarchaeota archaeon]|nr:ABC transporter permease [Candidatus Lokiarchaeota archaeon]
MTEQDITIEEIDYKDFSVSGNKKWKRLLKFYLLPAWRDPEFSAFENEIEKIKSKRRLFRRFLTPLTITGFLMVFFIVILAVYGPWLTDIPLQMVLPPEIPGVPFQPPSPQHPLGTTLSGYDVYARIIWGARTTISMAFIPIIIMMGGGLILGTISAYLGGTFDYLMMRFVDLMYSLPMLIVTIVLIPMLGQDLLNILLIWGVLAIPYNIRFMRSLVLQVKQLDYVKAAKVGGALRFKVMFKHIVPNSLSPLVITFFGGAAGTLLGLAGLAFLGIGDTTVATWGVDVTWARVRLLTAIWAAFWPGIFIGITSVGFMLIGDGMRDALDPRLHK